MSLRQLILAASLVLAPMAFGGSTAAQAATSCSCTDINMRSGVCTRYGKCHPLEMLAPAAMAAPKPLSRSCPARRQAVVCDGDSCVITCESAAAAKSSM